MSQTEGVYTPWKVACMPSRLRQHSARKHSLRIISTSANMVTSLLTPLKSKNSSTQTLKNLNLSSTKTIKAQHSTAQHSTLYQCFFFFAILGLSPSGPFCTFCGARMTSSLKLQEPSLAPLHIQMWLLAKFAEWNIWHPFQIWRWKYLANVKMQL